MKINISKRAAQWYKDEELSQSGYVRFFPRYGFGGHIPGFAIGVNSERPEQIHASTRVDHIIFYVDEKDAWYFNDVDLNVIWNETLKEPEFHIEDE